MVRNPIAGAKMWCGKEVLADLRFDHWVSSFGFSGIGNVSMTFSVPGAVYPGRMLRHFFGQDSTQYPHWMQFILSMVSVLEPLSTLIASVGHFFPQILHVMQLEGSNSMCPLLLSGYSLGTDGYNLVSGLENRLRISLPPNFITAMLSALRAADAGVDGDDQHGHVL